MEHVEPGLIALPDLAYAYQDVYVDRPRCAGMGWETSALTLGSLGFSPDEAACLSLNACCS